MFNPKVYASGRSHATLLRVENRVGAFSAKCGIRMRARDVNDDAIASISRLPARVIEQFQFLTIT